MIRVVKDCGDIKFEVIVIVLVFCCLFIFIIVIDEKFCSLDSVDFMFIFIVIDVDEVFVNDVLQIEVGLQYMVMLLVLDIVRIMVKNECV